MVKACRVCHHIVERGDKCPACGSRNLADDYSGEVYIIDVENSEIAKKMHIDKPGRYALKVR